MYLLYTLLAFIGGALIPLSLAPFDITLLSFVAPIVFLLLCSSKFSIKKKIFLALTFGIGQHLIGSSWVFVSINEFGNAGFILAGLLTLLFILVLSMYSVLKGFVVIRYLNNNNFKDTVIFYPILWILIDFLQSFLFTGFPWGFLGYSQLNTPLAGFAPVVTVYGVTYFIVLISSIIYYLYKNFSFRKAYIALLIPIILISGNLLNNVQWTKPYDFPLKVGLIQGNIDQLMKWDESHFKQSIKTYLDLTKPALEADLIVWPENAIIVPTPYSNELLAKISENVAKHDANLITGIPKLEKKQNQNVYFNTAVLLNKETNLKHSDDQTLQLYQKRHLVPFGEYVPFASYIRGIIDFFDLPMSDFSEGPENQEVFKINVHDKIIKIATLICFEIAYPFAVREESNKANIILTISNDTWFGNSIGPAQHLQIAQMRALENQKPLIRATNNGITAIIDYKGKIVDKAPQFVKYTLQSELTPRS